MSQGRDLISVLDSLQALETWEGKHGALWLSDMQTGGQKSDVYMFTVWSLSWNLANTSVYVSGDAFMTRVNMNQSGQTHVAHMTEHTEAM